MLLLPALEPVIVTRRAKPMESIWSTLDGGVTSVGDSSNGRTLIGRGATTFRLYYVKSALVYLFTTPGRYMSAVT